MCMALRNIELIYQIGKLRLIVSFFLQRMFLATPWFRAINAGWWYVLWDNKDQWVETHQTCPVCF